MTLSDVGVTGQQIDVVNGGDVHPDGRLLSVAEIQQAYRDLIHNRTQAGTPTQTQPVGTVRPTAAPHTSSTPANPGPHTSESTVEATPHTSESTVETAPHTSASAASAAPQAPAAGDAIPHDWVAVVAAHSGAGASCVALTLADAFDDAGRACRLIEVAHPSRSGLVAASTAELGNDATGAWRRGSRRLTTLYRRAAHASPDGWPADIDGAATVVDLGLPAPAGVRRLLDTRPTVIVVCRATVPGLRATEQVLADLEGSRVVLAAVGPTRWPGEVAASLGPRARRLREDHQLVCVPDDRHLQVTGPTNSPLPKSVSAAGRELLGLVGEAHPCTADAPPNPSAQSAPRKRGKTR